MDALTPGERRVAEIAAQGAGNREIARRLYPLAQDVEMHLRSAYRKLDLAGRDGLAAALRCQGHGTGCAPVAGSAAARAMLDA